MPQVGNYLGLTRRVCHFSPFHFPSWGGYVKTNLLGSRSFLVLILHLFIPHFTILSLLLSCVFPFIVRSGLQSACRPRYFCIRAVFLPASHAHFVCHCPLQAWTSKLRFCLSSSSRSVNWPVPLRKAASGMTFEHQAAFDLHRSALGCPPLSMLHREESQCLCISSELTPCYPARNDTVITGRVGCLLV